MCEIEICCSSENVNQLSEFADKKFMPYKPSSDVDQ